MKKVSVLDESDGEDCDTLTINKHYANHYDQWRLKEDLNRLKTKLGDVNDDGSSSEEEVLLPTEEFDKKFLITFSCLQSKDPKIYDENVKFFDENDIETKVVKKAEKPYLRKDYERELLLKTNGTCISDSDDDGPSGIGQKPRLLPSSSNEKDFELVKSICDQVDSDDGDDNDNGHFYIRKKVSSENSADQNDPDVSVLSKIDEKHLNSLKKYWNDPNLNSSEKFLRDYVLNQKVPIDDDDEKIAYDDILKEIEDDEKLDEKQEEFEHKYNFRFEEPDQEFIKQYPRTIETTIRKKSDKRQRKRQELKERKSKNKIRRIQEQKRLEALKKKDLEQKIEMIKKITGNHNLNLDIDDIEGDFDPDKYDEKISQAFNDDYYENEDESEEKPRFSDDDEQLGLEFDEDGFEKIELNAKNMPHCEDPDFNMNCDYVPGTLKTEKPQSLSRKRKNSSNQQENECKKKRLELNHNDDDNKLNKLEILTTVKELKKSVNDLKNIGCEDFIGDMPCRFKYTSVLPNDYGLTTEEILMADDKELDKWYSFKRMNKIKPAQVEKQEYAIYRKKRQNEKLKRKILPSLFGIVNDEANNDTSVPDKDDDNNKKQKKAKSKSENIGVLDKDDGDKKQQKKAKFKSKDVGGMQITDERLGAYGLNPKKFRRKIKYKPKEKSRGK